MQLSKRAQYGLRAMVCLADAYERGYLQTKELASREKLPTKFLESILSAMTRARFLHSKIGATGGYRLAKPPKEISIGQIIGRLEGKKLMENASPAHGTERPGETAVRVVQDQLSEALIKVLDATTLQELTEQVMHQSRGGQMYYI